MNEQYQHINKNNNKIDINLTPLDIIDCKLKDEERNTKETIENFNAMKKFNIKMELLSTRLCTK